MRQGETVEVVCLRGPLLMHWLWYILVMAEKTRQIDSFHVVGYGNYILIRSAQATHFGLAECAAIY